MNIPEQSKSVPYGQPIAHFVVCGLQLSSGDHHVGKIRSHRFVGNKLTITLAPMVKVIEVGSGGDATLKVAEVHDVYKLVFDECKVVIGESSHHTTVLRSNIGDIISLSNSPMTVVEIESIIAEKDQKD